MWKNHQNQLHNHGNDIAETVPLLYNLNSLQDTYIHTTTFLSLVVLHIGVLRKTINLGPKYELEGFREEKCQVFRWTRHPDLLVHRWVLDGFGEVGGCEWDEEFRGQGWAEAPSCRCHFSNQWVGRMAGGTGKERVVKMCHIIS